MPPSKRVKKKSATWSPSIRSFFFLAVLAVLGQFFLAQKGAPYTLWLGLLFYAGALWNLRRVPFTVGGKDPFPLAVKTETAIFCVILALAFGLRLFHIGQIPNGMHTDQGLTGLSALRILHEGWHPFPEALNFQVPEPFLFYQLAGWFGLAGSSYFTFHLFFVLLSLAAFPLLYWTFRQLAGPKTALLALFLLAVMRWNWIETRNGYPSVQVALYLFGALGFWLYGLKVRKQWPFLFSTLFLGTGLYTYQAFKVVPLLAVIYILYEYSTKWKGTKIKRPRLGWFFLLLLFLTAPLIHYDWQHKTLGNRESALFIGKAVAAEGSLRPLAEVWGGTALMFNREGDANPRHNIPSRRMLDDLTGILFLLGLGLAWRLRKKREGFYPLAGFFVMALPGLLSTDPAHSNRLVSLTPFVAYFAALAGTGLTKRAKQFWPDSPKPKSLFLLGLAVIAVLNAYTYFVTQAENPQCRLAFNPAATIVGRDIERNFKSGPGRKVFFAAPALFHNLTTSFLAYPAKSSTFEFNLGDWRQGLVPKDKDLLIFLEPLQQGIVDFLKTAYPGMEFHPEGDSGQTMLEVGSITAKDLAKARPWNRGLKGVYFPSAVWNSRPLAVRWDPVLNFTGKMDFPFTQPPPFRIRWSGSLEITKAGLYQFQLLSSDKAKLWLDGRPTALGKNLALSKGFHSLRINFEKDRGDRLALTFIWKKPGEEKWEVVPASAFGRISP